jgi:hypothetical protein
MPEISVEEAVERNCQAIMSGDVMLAMADFTPDALAGLMTAGAGFTGAMPMLHGYSIESHEARGEDHLFTIKFSTSTGDVTANSTWAEVDGSWRITSIILDGLPSFGSA